MPIFTFFEKLGISPFLSCILLIIPILPNLWCIWSANKHQFPTPMEKGLWMLTGIFVPVLGGVIYALFGLKRAKK